MKTIPRQCAALLLTLTIAGAAPAPMGTAFTYQGRLHDDGSPATGHYDFAFTLYDGPCPGGSPVGSPSVVPLAAVPVSNGLFSVSLNFGGAVFDGSARWLGIQVRTNMGNAYSTLSECHELKPVPYALVAGLAGSVTNNAITSSKLAPGAVTAPAISTFAPPSPGQVLTFMPTGMVWTTLSSPLAWLLSGNNVAPGDFLGSTNDQVVDVRVNNARVMRFQPDAQAPQIVGGHSANRTAVTNVPGAIIAGGGSAFNPHYIGGRYATVSGGAGHTNMMPFGTIGGGFVNHIQGTFDSTIGGGSHNTIVGEANVIGGGAYNNNLVGAFGTIGGGSQNRVESPYSSTIAGGYENTVRGQDGTIGGGSYNTAQADYAIIAGGQDNYIGTNVIDLIEFGFLTNYAGYSSILGGQANRISSIYSVAAGGSGNHVYGDYGHIGGGSGNRIGNASDYSSISSFSMVGGGSGNLAVNTGATVAGGINNTVRGLEAAILGGGGNTAWGKHSVVLGGQYNEAGTNTISQTVGSFSLAAGRRAKARHRGSFVWGDSTDDDIVSTNENSITMRAVGGVRIFSYVDPTQILAPAGVRLAPGSGSWSSLSDRNAKRDFSDVDARQVLAKVAALPISTWRYQGEAAGVRHIGPTAQDFAAAFAMGDSDTSITTVDADGVALAAIQGLHQKLADKEAEMESLKREMAEVKELLRRAMGK